jgi:hypothetical protein
MVTIVAGYHQPKDYPQDGRSAAPPAKGGFRKMRRIIESESTPARIGESTVINETQELANNRETARHQEARGSITNREYLCRQCQSESPDSTVAAELRELREMVRSVTASEASAAAELRELREMMKIATASETSVAAELREVRETMRNQATASDISAITTELRELRKTMGNQANASDLLVGAELRELRESLGDQVSASTDLRELTTRQAVASEERDKQTQRDIRASSAALSLIRNEEVAIRREEIALREEEARARVIALDELRVLNGLIGRYYQPQHLEESPPESIQSIEDRYGETDRRQGRQQPTDLDEDGGSEIDENNEQSKAKQEEMDEQSLAGQGEQNMAEQKEADAERQGKARHEDGKHRREDSFDSADFPGTEAVDDFC